MKWILLLITCFLVMIARGQSSYAIEYSLPKEDIKSLNLKTKFAGKEPAVKYIQQLPSLLLAKGFLAASIDSVRYDSTVATVSLYTGQIYHWGEVTIPAQYQPFINKTNGGKAVAGRPVAGSQLAEWQQAVLDYLSSNGHPFASVGLDSVILSGVSLYGKLGISEAPLYLIYRMHVIGISVM